MADSEEFRLRRLKHEEHLSRVFDEVMGLGQFADSSRGSVSSSKSGEPDEPTREDKSSGPAAEEDESNGSGQEEKMEEETVEPPLPRPSPTSSEQRSLFTIRTNDGEGAGRSGGAAFDDAVDGMEDDEDWHFALPVGTLDEVFVDEANGQKRQSGQERSTKRENSFPYQSTEDQEDEREREGSSESPDTSHSSQGHTPDNSQDGGDVNQAEETEDSQEGDVQRSEAAPVEESDPPLSAPISIKDEPVDEGYDAALLPQNSVKQIKEELEHQEEELRISSVYSVGGGNAFTVPPISQVPAAVPAPPPAAIFIPSRGAVLQAVAPLTIRPQVPVQNSLPVLAPGPPPRPPQPTNPGIVRCSGCLKVLLKGQTAFQRKGSTQLFCSTVCLTGHLPPANKNRTCSQCHREILQPRDMITIPAEDNSYLHFCGLFCLSVFRHNKKQPDKTPDKWTDKPPEKTPEKPPEKPVEKQAERSICSVCKISNRIEHEVNHQGRLHRLCSNACFVTWRKIRQLAMNCCEGCGLYCNSNSGACQKLTIERNELNFCGPTCVSTYKQSCRKMVECANCHKAAIVASTLIERDQKGKIQLYCSTACVEQSRPPQHVLSGTAFPCCQCKVSAVPQYHLAMVDGTIRNFCSYECVLTYRQSGQNAKPDSVNGISTHKDHYAPRQASPVNPVPPVPQDSSPVPHQGLHPNHTSVPALVPSHTAPSSPSIPGRAQAKAPADALRKSAEAGEPSRLTCHQCNKQFNVKPVLLCHQGRISMFCSRTCCDQYKTQMNVLATCEHCKQEKVLFDTISYNEQDLTFCSENCKLLFRYELTSRNNVHPWRPCTYCSGFSLKMLHSHYGGRMEEFCKPHCMSQYTVLYYGMGRCDGCRKQGYMTEKLQCLGSVRNFCNLFCLLQYCYMHFEASRHTNGIGTDQRTPSAPVHPNRSSQMTPVVADVVSLANGSVTQPSVSAETALTGALPSSNDAKNLDHASTQTDATRVPVFRRRQMKNKSVLCRPYTTDQETLCHLPETWTESAALSRPSGSSAEGEERVKAVLVPVPVPVPVFIPVPMNMYSQHTPVPVTWPLPVPVPMVAPPLVKDTQDAAVQSECLSASEEKAIQVPASTAAETDPIGSDIGNAESEAVSPRSNVTSLPVARSEGNTEPDDAGPNTRLEESTATSEPPSNSTGHQPPSSPMMDLETDFPSEPLDQKPPAPQRGVKRPRDCFSSRKRSRRRAGVSERSIPPSPTASKVNHLYGVKAWKSWVRQQNKQRTQTDLKEDILECNSVELSFALTRFVQEVRRPNGDAYSPDSIFYLCLGIQQYLFLQGRIENIFTDPLYGQFAGEITEMLRIWRPKFSPGGAVAASRVAESYLWECKQLGAYSPIVLLNTLLFFCTKHFGYTTLEQHRRLSFSNFTRCSKPCSRTGKSSYLLHRSSSTAPPRQETEHLRKRQTAEELEMHQNVANALQCPVRLYEFYLSRCPESVKKRTDVFYLQPEQNVHTHSCHWFTCQPLERSTLESMLTRILAVREVLAAAPRRPSAAGGGSFH